MGIVLSILCIAAALAAFVASWRAIKQLTSAKFPVAASLVRKDTIIYGAVVVLMIALYFIGSNLPGVLPGFGRMLAVVFIAISASTAVHAMRYARRHVPVIA